MLWCLLSRCWCLVMLFWLRLGKLLMIRWVGLLLVCELMMWMCCMVVFVCVGVCVIGWCFGGVGCLRVFV